MCIRFEIRVIHRIKNRLCADAIVAHQYEAKFKKLRTVIPILLGQAVVLFSGTLPANYVS
jgi:hypothetical protein